MTKATNRAPCEDSVPFHLTNYLTRLTDTPDDTEGEFE